jgi:hypothetical protein
LLRFNYWVRNHLNIYKDVDSPKHLQAIIRDITYNRNKNLFLKIKNFQGFFQKSMQNNQKNRFFLKKKKLNSEKEVK